MPLHFCLVRVKLIDMKKSNKGLFDKKRFEWIEQEKIKYLKNLSIEKGVAILESLTSPSVLNEFIHNFSLDNPLCLKISLKRRKWRRYQKYSKK